MKKLFLVTEDPETVNNWLIPIGGSFFYADSADEAFLAYATKLLTIEDAHAADSDPTDYQVICIDYPNNKAHVHIYNTNMGNWEDIDSTFTIETVL